MSSSSPNVGSNDVIPLLSDQIYAEGNRIFANLDASGVPSDATTLAGTLRPPNFVEKGAELTQSASNVVYLRSTDNANMRATFARNLRVWRSGGGKPFNAR